MDETIYFGDSKKDKNNLILAVGIDQVVLYKITTENTNSIIFLEFLKTLNDKLKNNFGKKYLLIMDNLKSHKKKKLYNICLNQKSTYCSMLHTTAF